MKLKSFFIDLFKGTALGLGALPGVSAGTAGIVVNIYDKLITSIANLRKKFKPSFLALIPIMLGWVGATVVLLYLEGKVWPYAPFIIVCICAGFTIGGLPVILRQLKGEKITGFDILRMVIGFVVAAGIGVGSVLAYVYRWFDLSAAFMDPNNNIYIYFVVFFVGLFAAITCLIPGISGTMVIFIFGIYNPLIGLYSGSNSMLRNHDRIGSGLLLTAILAVGVIIGLIVVSKLMKSLLEKKKRQTYTCVLGFVLGSIVSMFVSNQIWGLYNPTYDAAPYVAQPAFKEIARAPWQYAVGAVLLVITAIATMILIKKFFFDRQKIEENSDNKE